jgi:hypothetical protein
MPRKRRNTLSRRRHHRGHLRFRDAGPVTAPSYRPSQRPRLARADLLQIYLLRSAGQFASLRLPLPWTGVEPRAPVPGSATLFLSKSFRSLRSSSHVGGCVAPQPRFEPSDARCLAREQRSVEPRGRCIGEGPSPRRPRRVFLSRVLRERWKQCIDPRRRVQVRPEPRLLATARGRVRPRVHRRRAKPQVTLPPPSTSLDRSEPGYGSTVKSRTRRWGANSRLRIV